ncbi:hypothetical protein N431DRAFT_429542 [Stipitochalara longipes BDJ]|nr:hypothetical protein N431DRAFT_429542 [Stipitochalara longipes BDJ]
MPIALVADPAERRPKWSTTILNLHWFFQFITLGVFQLITIFFVWVLLVGVPGDGNDDGQPPARPSHYLFLTTMIFIFLSNAAIFCAILYEWASTFVPSKYYKIQIVKSVYFLVLVILVLSSGLNLPMEGNVSGVAWVWATLWKMLIFVAPFWSSMLYAIVIKKRVSRDFGEGGEVAL